MDTRCICCTFVCLFASATICPAVGPYVITDVGDLGGGESRAYAVNAAGEVVGRSRAIVESHYVWRAFLYSGGALLDLGTLGGDESSAWDVNDAGEVVGWASNPSGPARAFLYSGGTMEEVDPGFGGWTGVAYGINDSSQVVGVAARKYTLLQYDHAFRWTDANEDGVVDAGEVLELLALNGQTTSTSYARDVNEAGQVVGYSRAGLHDHAFFFHDANGDGVVDPGELVDLGTFGGNASLAYGINDAGQVVGGAQTAASRTHAFVWTDANGNWALDAGEMADLGTLGGDSSEARAISQSGQVVGYAQNADAAVRAFVYAGGKMLDLNELIHSEAGWTLQEAWDVNQSGQIVGIGKNPGNMTHGFVLTPAAGGDANLDGCVDGLDYNLWSLHYLEQQVPPWSEGGCEYGNFNADEVVDGLDYNVWSLNYRLGCEGAAVHEPALAVLLVAGLGPVLRRRANR